MNVPLLPFVSTSIGCDADRQHPFNATELAHSRCHAILARASARFASEQVFADISRTGQ